MVDVNVDTNIDTGTGAPPPDSDSFDRSMDTGRDRRSVRDELREQFNQARQRDEEPEEDTAEPDRAAPGEGDQQREPPQQQQTQQQQTQTQPPPTWAPDARTTWAQVPPAAQQAILKREQDIQRGVQQLRQHYNEIDQAIAPYDQAIRQFGKTRGEFVAQLGAWFNALTNNPVQAFPALVQSYADVLQRHGYDVNQLIGAFQPQQQQQQQTNGKDKPEEISPAVQQYIQGLEQKLNTFQQQVGQQFGGVIRNFQEQSEAKTYDMLNTWAQNKPYFEDVRVMMGHFLTPDPNTGQSLVPFKDGRIDLDTAYEMACRAHPEVARKIYDDYVARQQAEQKAAQVKAAKDAQANATRARRAAVSAVSSAPGSEPSRGNKKDAKGGKSVRESLMAAIEEHRG